MIDAAYVPLTTIANRTDLPMARLRAEAKANRLLCLLAGRRLMFDLDTVLAALDERARRSAQKPESTQQLIQPQGGQRDD